MKRQRNAAQSAYRRRVLFIKYEKQLIESFPGVLSHVAIHCIRDTLGVTHGLHNCFRAVDNVAGGKNPGAGGFAVFVCDEQTT